MPGFPKESKESLVWKVIHQATGEVAFESDDPQAVVDKAAELEESKKHEGFGTPFHGLAAGSYFIEGDPFELGVVQEHDDEGNLLRGPKKLRRPRKRKK